MTDLSTLLSSVESGSGALDDETLARILCALQGDEYGDHGIACGDDGSDEFDVWDASGNRVKTFARGGYRDLCPDVSVGAVLALVEARLPGWMVGISQLSVDRWEGCLTTDNGRFLIDGDTERFGKAPTPARALLAALIRAEMEKVK